MLNKLHQGGEGRWGLFGGQDCWELGGRIRLTAPLSRIAGCASPGPSGYFIASLFLPFGSEGA